MKKELRKGVFRTFVLCLSVGILFALLASVDKMFGIASLFSIGLWLGYWCGREGGDIK